MLLGCVAAAGADGALASPAGGAGAVPAADAAAAAGVAVAGAVVGADTESPPASARGATGAARLVTTDGRGALAGRRRSASTAGATEMGAAVVAPLPLPPPLPVPLPVVLSPKAPMGSPAAMTDRDAWPAVSRVGRRARRRIVRGGGGEGGRGGGGGGTGSGARTPPRQPGTGLPLRPEPSRRTRPSHGMEGGEEGWALQQRGGELPDVCLTGAVGAASGEGKGGRSSAAAVQRCGRVQRLSGTKWMDSNSFSQPRLWLHALHRLTKVPWRVERMHGHSCVLTTADERYFSLRSIRTYICFDAHSPPSRPSHAHPSLLLRRSVTLQQSS